MASDSQVDKAEELDNSVPWYQPGDSSPPKQCSQKGNSNSNKYSSLRRGPSSRSRKSGGNGVLRTDDLIRAASQDGKLSKTADLALIKELLTDTLAHSFCR
jgi:phage I-like protein